MVRLDLKKPPAPSMSYRTYADRMRLVNSLHPLLISVCLDPRQILGGEREIPISRDIHKPSCLKELFGDIVGIYAVYIEKQGSPNDADHVQSLKYLAAAINAVQRNTPPSLSDSQQFIYSVNNVKASFGKTVAINPDYYFMLLGQLQFRLTIMEQVGLLFWHAAVSQWKK